MSQTSHSQAPSASARAQPSLSLSVQLAPLTQPSRSSPSAAHHGTRSSSLTSHSQAASQTCRPPDAHPRLARDKAAAQLLPRGGHREPARPAAVTPQRRARLGVSALGGAPVDSARRGTGTGVRGRRSGACTADGERTVVCTEEYPAEGSVKMAPGIFSTAAGDGLGEPMGGAGEGFGGDVPPDRRFACDRCRGS